MMGQHKITLHQNFLEGISGIGQQTKTGCKVHDFTHYQPGRDYVIEPAEQLNHHYMTGQSKGIKPGDRILLQQNRATHTYAVKQIDYYADPSDMWIALLEEKQN